MAKVPLIHNPVSGGAKGGARLRQAEALLARSGVQVEPYATERPGHATDLARALAKEHGTLLVLGGDGTLSEASNGILGLPAAKRPTLGFIPGGTGNDFLRDFDILDVESAAKAIAAGRTRAVDAVQVQWTGAGGGSRFAINVVGCGIAAKAGARFGRQFRWAGRKGYDLAAAVELLQMRATPTLLEQDGRAIRGDFPLVMACNSVHTGGAMKMAPDASPTDGLLDVLRVEGAGPMELMGLLATKLRKGEHVQNRKVTVEKAAKVRIAPDSPSPVLLDGEVMGATPVQMQVLPGALTLLA